MNMHQNKPDYRRGFCSMVAMLMLTVPIGSVTATAAMTRLSDGVNMSTHPTITSAYNNAIEIGNDQVISAQAGTFRENLIFDPSATIRLNGGYDATYERIVGNTFVEGKLTITSGTVKVSGITLTSAPAGPVRIIYLHHSTGANIWYGGVPEFITAYNDSRSTDYQVSERAYPNSPYPWANYPYDYWKLWVDTTGTIGYQEQDTLDILAADYDVIVFKHCFPVSDIVADSDTPDISSNTQSLQNYKLQYAALKERLHQFPAKKFIVWTGAALTELTTTPENAERARQFFEWVRNSWDEKKDNIFVWDLWTLETGGGLYLLPEYAASSVDPHPNGTLSLLAAPLIGQRIVDVIEGAGDSASITGQ